MREGIVGVADGGYPSPTVNVNDAWFKAVLTRPSDSHSD